MASGEVVVAAAGRRDQLRSMTPREVREQEEHLQASEAAAGTGGRFRTPITSGHVLDGPVHGVGSAGATLCGIPQAEIFVRRHLFDPAGRSACSDCAAVVRGDGI